MARVKKPITKSNNANKTRSREGEASKSEASEADVSEEEASETDGSEKEASEAEVSEKESVASEADVSEKEASEADVSEKGASEAEVTEKESVASEADVSEKEASEADVSEKGASEADVTKKEASEASSDTEVMDVRGTLTPTPDPAAIPPCFQSPGRFAGMVVIPQDSGAFRVDDVRQNKRKSTNISCRKEKRLRGIKSGSTQPIDKTRNKTNKTYNSQDKPQICNRPNHDTRIRSVDTNTNSNYDLPEIIDLSNTDSKYDVAQIIDEESPKPNADASNNSALSDLNPQNASKILLKQYLDSKDKEDDPTFSFFHTMSKTVKKMPVIKQLEIKRDIFRIVNEAEMTIVIDNEEERLTNRSSESTQRPSHATASVSISNQRVRCTSSSIAHTPSNAAGLNNRSSESVQTSSHATASVSISKQRGRCTSSSTAHTSSNATGLVNRASEAVQRSSRTTANVSKRGRARYTSASRAHTTSTTNGLTGDNSPCTIKESRSQESLINSSSETAQRASHATVNVSKRGRARHTSTSRAQTAYNTTGPTGYSSPCTIKETLSPESLINSSSESAQRSSHATANISKRGSARCTSTFRAHTPFNTTGPGKGSNSATRVNAGRSPHMPYTSYRAWQQQINSDDSLLSTLASETDGDDDDDSWEGSC